MNGEVLGNDEGPESVDSRKSNIGQKIKKFLRLNIFLILILVGFAVGIVMGVCIRMYHPDFAKTQHNETNVTTGEYKITYSRTYDQKKNVMYLYFPWELFLRMLELMIIPLVASSLIAGMAAIPSKASGRMGGFAVLYYMITNVMAVLLGILLVATIKPGVKDQGNDVKRKDNLIDPTDALLDIIRNVIPANIISATFEKANTTYTDWEMRNFTVYEEKTKYIKALKDGTIGGTNVLGIVVFAVVLGVIIGKMGAKGLPLRRFMDSLQEAIIRIVRIIMWYTPIGIASILATKIVQMDDPEEEFKLLGMYMASVIVGLIIHGFIVLPIIYVIFVRRNPFKLLVHVSQALLTALGTASSYATMPITLSNLVDNAGIDRRVVYFVIPVGATINMDGTALYEAVASIFLAQMEGYTLDARQYVIVSVTATAAAIGAAGVPEAGLVTMMIVLQALGLPTELVGLILAVDWFLDRLRTTINVWGDSIGTGVVQALARKQLEQLDDDLAQMEDIDVHDNYGYDGVDSLDQKGVARVPNLECLQYVIF